MRAAFSQNELNAFRTRNQRSKWYLAVHRPASIFSSKILTTPVQQPASTILIDTVFDVGDKGATSAHLTAWIGTTAGASDQGKIRLRMPVSGSVVRVAETGSGLLRYTAGNFVTVMRQFYPWVKHPLFDTATSTWRMDYSEVHASQLRVGNYGPVVIMGPPMAGFLDGETLTGSFVGTSTQTVDSAINTAEWEWPGGSKDSKVGAEHDPTVKIFDTASPGGDYYSLTITDVAGISQISRRLAFPFTDRTGPATVEFAEISGGLRDGGYSGTLRVLSGGNTDQFPDGAEIVIFEESSYAGQASTIGGNYPFRTNVVARGWILDDTTTINPFSGEVMFNFTTLHGILDKTISYDIFHSYAAASGITGASPWQEAESLSLDRAALDVVKHRSTIAEITDFHLGSGTHMQTFINFQDLPQSSIWKQLQLNYGEKGTRGLVSTDLQSNIWATEDANISGLSANLPVAMHIEKQDRRDAVQIAHPHLDPNARTEMYGVMVIPATSQWRGSATSIIPVGAESPGNVLGYFGGRREHARGIAIDGQDRLTRWVGNWRAHLNNPYPNVVVPLAGNIKFDVVPQSRTTLTASATDVENVRGIDWNNQEFYPHTANLTYNNQTGTVLTTVQLEQVTDGRGGSAITFPRPEHIAPLPPPDPPPPPPPNGPQGTLITFNDTVGAYKYGNNTWNAANADLTGANIQDLTGTNAPIKGATLFPMWKGNVGKVYRTPDAGGTWEDVSPSQNPTNGTTSAINFIGYQGNPTATSQHLVLGRQLYNGNWNSWLVVTEDNGTTWNFQELSGAVAPGTSIGAYGAVALVEDAFQPAIFSGGQYARLITKVNDTQAALIFDSGSKDGGGVPAAGKLRSRTINVTGGTSANSASPQDVFSTGSEITHWTTEYIGGTTLFSLYMEQSHTAGEAARLKAVAGTVSGDTFTWGTPLQLNDASSGVNSNSMNLGGLTATTALAAWLDTKDNVARARHLTVSGTTLSQGDAVDLATDANYDELWVDSFDGTAALIAGTSPTGGDAHASGVIWAVTFSGASIVTNVGTTAFTGATNYAGNPQVYFTSASNFIILYRDTDANGDYLLMPGEYTSGSIDFKTTHALEADASSSVSLAYMDKVANNTFVITYTPSGSASGRPPQAHKIATVAGASIDLGPRTQSSKSSAFDGPYVTAVANNLALTIFDDWDDVLGGGSQTNVPTYEPAQIATGGAGQAKAYGMAVDIAGGNAYATYSDNTNLQIDNYSLPDLTKQTTVNLGAGTIAQADARTQVAYVRNDSLNSGRVYVYGRMSNPAGVGSDPSHIIRSTDNAATFTLVENAWGTDHCGALITGPNAESVNGINAIRNLNNSLGAVYVGPTKPTLRGTIPYEVNPGGVTLAQGYLITAASSNKSNMIQYAQSPFTRWYDISNGYPNSGGVVGIGIT